jgi:hypothetical protein
VPVDLSLQLRAEKAIAADMVEPSGSRTVTVSFPVDTIASVRSALERIVLVATGALSTLDAGVAKYGDAETLRGVGQLLSALSQSMVKIFYFLLLVPVLHGHAWFGKACVLHSLSGIL